MRCFPHEAHLLIAPSRLVVCLSVCPTLMHSGIKSSI